MQLVNRFVICDPGGFIQDAYRVPVGPLPPGEYRVEVANSRTPDWGSGTFVVRDAAPAPFRVAPSAVPANVATEIVIVAPDVNLCTSEHCSDAVVSIDGTPVPESAKQQANGAIRVTLPPHAPGLVSVSVDSPRRAGTVQAALYFFDRAAPPDPSVFERILFPVLYSGGGQFGSQWVSEVALANPYRWNIETYNRIDPFVCITSPCGERISAFERRRFQGENHPNGVALLVPRANAMDLSFGLRARDVSRSAQGFGTAVPVVREAQMFTRATMLLNVPVDPRYRAKLRVYTFNRAVPVEAWIRFALLRANGTIEVPRFQRGAGCEPSCGTTPIYEEYDLPAGAADERVDIELWSEHPELALFWGFVAVTNNETQEVTIVTPDGDGTDSRCQFCR